MKALIVFLALVCGSFTVFIAAEWETLNPVNSCTPRHENSLATIDDKIVLLGGRGIKPVEVYDPETNAWSSFRETPIEMSHFQAITYRNEIWVIGAFTGPYPHEIPIPHIYIFSLSDNQWRIGPEIPETRRRGAAGAVVYENRIYLVGGETDGHWDGTQAWFDEYDPVTDVWKALPDAPHARDHASIAVVGQKLYVVSGRVSNAKTNNVLNTTFPEMDVYDFTTGKWQTMPEDLNLPTQRAGASALAVGNKLFIIGGESGAQEAAHSEVEAFNTETQSWEILPPLNRGRHGTGATMIDHTIYTAAGSGNRGGGPELNSIEIMN